MISLAIKYRPVMFCDITEQSEVKTILQNQLASNDLRNAYLFVGGAGTGKTTTARIFANEINKGQGNPIELDAASNNSVDDVREIGQQARTKSIDSEYRIYILDECHAFSNNAWQAMLKLLEEPPLKTIFIFCTTNPEKIPKTILSRVQRYDFRRISQQGIVERLEYIIDSEFDNTSDDAVWAYDKDAIEYIAKVADGGMRDAITMLDKCLAYSNELTLENTVKALGLADYDVMIKLSKAIVTKDSKTVIDVIEDIHAQGKDLKTFIKTYMNFMLDVCKFAITKSYDYVQIPTYCGIESYPDLLDMSNHLLDVLVNLNEKLRWETTSKYVIEATLLLECLEEDK